MQLQSLKEMRLSVSRQAFLSEEEAMAPILQATTCFAEMQPSIFADAAFLLKRAHAQKPDAVESLLKQFRLDSEQGIALMRLVEALPRIPDASTAYALMEEIFAHPCWESEGEPKQALVEVMAASGLKIIHQLLGPKAPSALQKKLQAMSMPLFHKALLAMCGQLAKHFVLGETVADAVATAGKRARQDYLYSYDVLGEAALTEAQAKAYYQGYLAAIAEVAKSGGNAEWVGFRDGISIKLSALHPRFHLTHRKLVFSHLYPRLKALAVAAKNANILLTIDAEESTRFDLTLELYEMLLKDPDLAGFSGLGLALQAYQKRALPAIEYLQALAEETERQLPIRLVKGAYWDSEIKQAQAMGLEHYPVFTHKAHTDLSYLACARKLLDAPPECFLVQFATHNAHTIAAILRYVKPHNRTEFQRLHGMGARLFDVLKEEQVCRIYAPLGAHEALLPYLIRRLLENGASSSFVHQLHQAEDAQLLAFPKAKGASALPLPRVLYGKERLASAGVAFGNIAALHTLTHSIAQFTATKWQAAPIINGKAITTSETMQIASPSNFHSITGSCHYATEMEVMQAVTLAESGFSVWRQVPLEKRASMLEKAAQLLEKQRAEVLALLVYEAGKTLKDAEAELRETLDFLYYYAATARQVLAPRTLPAIAGETNTLELRGRGVFLSISPWNFPLAIFTGQVAAALVCGNAVVAKPAEQTPLIAAFMTRILLASGIPPVAIQLLPGSGVRVGQRLVEDKAISGVVFTGSSQTAQHIARSLAKRSTAIIPLIAETGGINAMLLDSSALPEQAVQDILHSAYGASGQRCSALRVLYLPEEGAEAFLELLKGAAEQLVIGFPEDLETDIASVINPEAQARIMRHVDAHREKLVFEVAIPPLASRKGCYVPLVAIRLQSITELEGEIFGPVLHIITYKPEQLQQVIAEINSTGYALTFGIHSRLESRAKELSRKIEAGNIYINRGMTGAVVGQQPFGGHGLSGTGFKAGGPHYLLRFVTEITTTTNTTALGGNIALLGGKNGL